MSSSEVTEDLGYKVEKVQSTRVEADRIDETFRSTNIGQYPSIIYAEVEVIITSLLYSST